MCCTLELHQLLHVLFLPFPVLKVSASSAKRRLVKSGKLTPFVKSWWCHQPGAASRPDDKSEGCPTNLQLLKHFSHFLLTHTHTKKTKLTTRSNFKHVSPWVKFFREVGVLQIIIIPSRHKTRPLWSSLSRIGRKYSHVLRATRTFLGAPLESSVWRIGSCLMTRVHLIYMRGASWLSPRSHCPLLIGLRWYHSAWLWPQMNSCRNPLQGLNPSAIPLPPPSTSCLPPLFLICFSPSFFPSVCLQCTPSCGPGYRHRVVLCKSGESGETLPESKCPKQGRPTSRVRCNLQRCPPPLWVTGPWGEVRAAMTTWSERCPLICV